MTTAEIQEHKNNITELILSGNEESLALAEQLSKSVNIDFESLPIADDLRQWCLFLVFSDEAKNASETVLLISKIISLGIRDMVARIKSSKCVHWGTFAHDSFSDLPTSVLPLLFGLDIILHENSFMHESFLDNIDGAVFCTAHLDKITIYNIENCLGISKKIAIHETQMHQLFESYGLRKLFNGCVEEVRIDGYNLEFRNNNSIPSAAQLERNGQLFYDRIKQLEEKGLKVELVNELPF